MASTVKEALVGSTKRWAWAAFCIQHQLWVQFSSLLFFLPSLSQHQCLNTAFFSTSVSISPWMLPVISHPIREGEWSFACPGSQTSWGLLQAPPPTRPLPVWTPRLFPRCCFSIPGADLIVPRAEAILQDNTCQFGN